MRRQPIFWIISACVCALSASSAGYAALSSASDAHVAFEAVGPAGLKIDGSTPDLSVSEADGNLTITVPLGNLSTGISLRDHHMKEKYLEVPKYPAGVLTVAKNALKVPAAGGQVDADVPGTLALHGQTRPVSVHYSAKSDGTNTSAQGKFHINMTEFGIVVPTYLGVTVKPDVDVSATFRVGGS
ncbi:MAG TPA: YceI family protein [Polyangiaceae bacterium]|nr:YceI family protein [Polyangiaceae bacterium]